MGRLPRILLIVAAIVILCYHASFYWSNSIDDAYITFRYARNWMAGEGMVYNPGERLEGITNLGWAMLLAPFTGLDVLYVSKGFGLLFGVGTIFLVESWIERAKLSLVPRILALALLVVVPWVPTHTMLGMETSAELFLVTLGWSMYERERERGGPWSSLGMGLGPWVRPDAALVPIVIGGLHWLRPQLDRRILRAVGVVAALGLLLVALKMLWFGELIPNTFYVKTGWPPLRGWYYLSYWLTQPSAWLSDLCLLAVAFSGWLAAKRRDLRAIPGLLFGVWLVAVVLENGDFMVNYRLITPAWPAAVVAVALLAEEFRAFVPSVALLLPLGLLPSAARVYTLDQCTNPEAASNRPKESWIPNLEAGFQSRTSFPIAWTLVHAGREAVSFPDIGVLGYLYDGPVVDPLGLTDRAIAGRIPGVRDWDRMKEAVSYLILDTRSGAWERYRQGLVESHWNLVDGCGFMWVLANPEKHPAALTAEELAERLQVVRRRAPRERWLDLEIAGELLRVAPDQVETWAQAMGTEERCALGLDGCSKKLSACGAGIRVRPEDWADPQTWPDPGGRAVDGSCRTARREAQNRWEQLTLALPEPGNALALKAAQSLWSTPEVEARALEEITAMKGGEPQVDAAVEATRRARAACVVTVRPPPLHR